MYHFVVEHRIPSHSVADSVLGRSSGSVSFFTVNFLHSIPSLSTEACKRPCESKTEDLWFHCIFQK